ncbi:unnamed protein product [Brassica oleracea var. botrytis]
MVSIWGSFRNFLIRDRRRYDSLLSSALRDVLTPPMQSNTTSHSIILIQLQGRFLYLYKRCGCSNSGRPEKHNAVTS